ncbi:Usp17ld [Symbiodinium sp. CCMP2592]|nr:Usp17ld [Symbiodinium sp. CCMP2592]
MAAPVPAVGFANLGASCFINSSIQAIFASSTLRQHLKPNSDSEQAIHTILQGIHQPSERRVPNDILRLYYNNRQEDAAEFLNYLLLECPSLHHVLQGIEVPRLSCQHCSHSRNLPQEKFLVLQLPIAYEQPLFSVQFAMDRYLSEKHLKNDVEEWTCWQADCLNAGVAEDPCFWSTSILEWPNVLMMTLKRWDNDGVLTHPVVCEPSLKAGTKTYKLQAIVSHIGATADSGHYLAYRRHGDRILRCNDHVITMVPTFDLPSDEKAYILLYEQDVVSFDDNMSASKVIDLDVSSDSDVVIESDRCHPGTKRPGSEQDQPQSKRSTSQGLTDIELEALLEHEIDLFLQEDKTNDQPENKVSEEQSDSAKAPPPMPTTNPSMPSEPANNQRRPMARFTANERTTILDIVTTCSSLKEAMPLLRAAVPDFNTEQQNTPKFISMHTLRNWVRKPDSLRKAIALLNPPVNPPKTRAAPALSARAALSPELQEGLAEALENYETPQQIIDMLHRTVPGFSVSDQTAENYVPKTSVIEWCRRSTVRTWFATNTDHANDTWEKEFENVFGIVHVKPQLRVAPVLDPSNQIDQWLVHGSWTFCPKCGRRRPATATNTLISGRAALKCKLGCDPDATDLLKPAEQEVMSRKLNAYVTPTSQYWEPMLLHMGLTGLPLASLSTEDVNSLSVLDLKIDYKTRRGGNASTTSKQKTAVIRGRWKALPLTELKRSDAANHAFSWLVANNETYAFWVQHHRQLAAANITSEHWREIPTAQLLLGMPGIEIAARPLLYPLASFGDSDILTRLTSLGRIPPTASPSTRTSFMRKITSRCLDYSKDFPLHALLYDMCMGRTITSLISVANQKQIAPEHASIHQDMFEGYWFLQLRKMEDVCRVEYERTQDVSKSLPNVFFTVAPAEWRYLLPHGLTFDASLSEQQDLITLHLHHTLQTLLESQLLKNPSKLKSLGIANVKHWSYRFEFQARGTLHVHAVLWADLLPGWSAADLTARSNETTSPFLEMLESMFKCRADVQCGEGTHCLMRYVAGYLAKASDALQFVSKQAASEDSRWKQAYRLLCRKSPTEQEIIMEFAGLSMVKHSFSGFDLYAPIPGSSATNNSRQQYLAYQRCLKDDIKDARSLTFIQWLRQYQVVGYGKEMNIQRRNVAGPAANKTCGVAISFPFELLDIYIGAWAASCLPGMTEERLLPTTPPNLHIPGYEHELARRRSFAAPKMCEHLKAALCLDMFQLDGADLDTYNPDLEKFFASIEPELILRGINADRISTFKAKIQASNLLLLKIRDGLEDSGFWTAHKLPGLPQRHWSVEQQAVLDWLKKGLAIDDAANTRNRILQVSGSPGTGKTEVVIAAAKLALDDDCRVLIAGPIGLLVAMYKLKLPASDRLTMETIHSAFKITRLADSAYIPPGRLRRYDVIIFDEVSQIDGQVWEDLKVALGELQPGPLIMFVGDFQQLQPVHGQPQLQLDLDAQVAAGTVDRIDLQNHGFSRTIDPEMLEFLHIIRTQQPSRAQLESFFLDRQWPNKPEQAAARAKAWENANGKNFMFLTVTNKAADTLNRARLSMDFPREASLLDQGAGIPGEANNVILAQGMRVRLTYNVNKDDGFVNGNTGTVRLVLRRDVFVMQSAQNTSILVYPITLKGRKHLPVVYGYATTMRRAQGATLEGIGLWFDRRRPDRGYAYVGTSRAKQKLSVFHVGRLRQTDWLPVGLPREDEHTQLSGLSESTDAEDEESSDLESDSTASSPGFDVSTDE